MAVFSYGWCRVEGCLIPDLRKEYETFINMPSNIRIFYPYAPRNDTMFGSLSKS